MSAAVILIVGAAFIAGLGGGVIVYELRFRREWDMFLNDACRAACVEYNRVLNAQPLHNRNQPAAMSAALRAALEVAPVPARRR